jgi:transaldolase
MSILGNSNFDDELAADFLADFTEAPGEVALLEALAPAADAAEDQEYLEADVAGPALAAAEIVAALAGKPFANFPPDLLKQLQTLDISDLEELQELAVQAVTAAAQDSEVRAQAAASSTLNDWLNQQQDLLKRLA